MHQPSRIRIEVGEIVYSTEKNYCFIIESILDRYDLLILYIANCPYLPRVTINARTVATRLVSGEYVKITIEEVLGRIVMGQFNTTREFDKIPKRYLNSKNFAHYIRRDCHPSYIPYVEIARSLI